MLITRTVELKHDIESWVTPPSPPHLEKNSDELHRLRISRFILPIMLLTLASSFLSLFFLPPHADSTYIVAVLVGPIVTSVSCCALCHVRRPHFAAWLYVLSMVFSLTFRFPQLDASQSSGIDSLMFFFLPICAAGILLGAGACWLVSFLIELLLAGYTFEITHDIAQSLAAPAEIVGTLLIGTAIVSLGMAGYHRAIFEASNSQELALLNNELESSIVTLAEREAETERQRVFLDSLLDSIDPDLFAVTDARGRIIRCNDAFASLFGQQREDIIGMSIRRIHPALKAFFDNNRAAIHRVVNNRLSRIEHHFLINEHHYARIEANISWVAEMSALIIIARDVTVTYRNQRNIDIMRAVTQACAGAAEENIVAFVALRALIDGLWVNQGVIVTQDQTNQGYARLLASSAQASDAHALDWVDQLRDLIVTSPVRADSQVGMLRVIATGEPIFHYVPGMASLEGEKSTYATTIPLRFDGMVLGAMALVYRQDDQSMRDVMDPDLLLAVADEVAASLHRARLYEDARRMAHFDPLTGLRNHRALQDTLRRELASGASQGLPVSVVMLDIDHFRRFNETYGHDVGDRALRAVANAIQQVLGDDYVAARYGGEEFAIVLPTVDPDRADEISQLIIEAIANVSIVVDAPSGMTSMLTASIGHATFPLHASASSSIIKAADLALYAAKRSGRNCVCAYTPTLLEVSTHLLPAASTLAVREAGDISLPTGADVETVQAFITAIDLRDGYTAAHSEGVSRYAAAIGTEMQLPTEHVEALRLGGLVHDVGKIGTPDHILRKPGRLEPEEWVLMQQHATMGEEILRPVEQLRHLLPLVRWHHERLDGSGYPDGLRGDQIPLLVRILSVADVFEAYTAERPYHPGRAIGEGLVLLRQEVAKERLDAQVVNAFESILVGQRLIEDTRRDQPDMQEAA